MPIKTNGNRQNGITISARLALSLTFIDVIMFETGVGFYSFIEISPL